MLTGFAESASLTPEVTVEKGGCTALGVLPLSGGSSPVSVANGADMRRSLNG